MRVTVKTGGLLYEYLPPQRTGNRVTLDLDDGATPLTLMQQLQLPDDDTYLVIVNDELVPEEQRARRLLADGDRVSINPPLKGG